jgi:hypothetical protein
MPTRYFKHDGKVIAIRNTTRPRVNEVSGIDENGEERTFKTSVEICPKCGFVGGGTVCSEHML